MCAVMLLGIGVYHVFPSYNGIDCVELNAFSTEQVKWKVIINDELENKMSSCTTRVFSEGLRKSMKHLSGYPVS